MNTHPTPSAARGTSLIEVVLAMGVLAMVVPLVFGLFAKSSESAAAARAESRSGWIIPVCLSELAAARDGTSQALPKREPGLPYPSSGGVVALAFTDDGRLVDRLPADLYEKGSARLANQAIRYLVTIQTVPDPATTPATTTGTAVVPMSTLHLILEYPASSPARKRRKLDFHTRIQ